MARKEQRVPENTSGNFYVDATCIDCGTCYWVAPDSFRRHGDHSAVYEQPADGAATAAAYRALLSCPVFAIGAGEKGPAFHQAMRDLPREIAGGVYHCGFHSEKSFGATSYFVRRGGGNLLIDGPRYTRNLVAAFARHGGIDLHLLTHKDDIADTDRYQQHFGGRRLLHRDDVTPATAGYEMLMEGEEPVALADDLLMIPVPGHTRGSVCFLYQEKFLFTGDHLAFSRGRGHLAAFREACWYDFAVQTTSMKKLLDFSFEYILPGHGAPYQAGPDTMREALETCIRWMEAEVSTP